MSDANNFYKPIGNFKVIRGRSQEQYQYRAIQGRSSHTCGPQQLLSKFRIWNFHSSCYQKNPKVELNLLIAAAIKKFCKQKLTGAATNSGNKFPCFPLCLVLRIFDIFEFFSCHSLYADTSVVSKILLASPILYSSTPKQPNILEITLKA